MHRWTSWQNIGLIYARSESRSEAKASRWMLGLTGFFERAIGYLQAEVFITAEIFYFGVLIGKGD